MSVQQNIDLNLRRVISSPMSLTVNEVSQVLSAENVGAVMLTDDQGELAGIVSERDIVKAMGIYRNAAGDMPIADIMVRNVMGCSPETSLEDVLSIMSRHEIRHLPVLRNKSILGMVSVRDILDFQRAGLLDDLKRREQDARELQRDHDLMEGEFQAQTLALKSEFAQRKQIEVALRDSEFRLRAFFDHSPSIMYQKNRNHVMELVNPKYLEFHNTTEEAVVGKRGASKLGEEKRAELEKLDREVMKTGRPTHESMAQISGDGEERIFFVTKFPIYGADGEVQGVGGINTDVTDLHDREEKLVLAKAEAERAAQLSEIAAREAQAANRSKSEFLANMSHEIRTPMNGVLGMTTVLSHTNLTPAQQESVDTIKESGETLLELLNDILDLSKIEAGRIELEAVDFSLPKLLASIERLWLPRAQSNGLEFRIVNRAVDIDVIKSDSSRIRQILANLLSNAIKFTDSGLIELNVRTLPREDSQIEVRFEIRDTGIGIHASNIAKLFQPFSQEDSSTTRKYGGTGLGLSISKQLVELLGGDIGVESTPNVGTSFWFSLLAERGDPTVAADEPMTDSDLPAITTDPNRPLRILVAEDNLVNQKVIMCMLEVIDCQVDVVENGVEAVSAVTDTPYDLVLMDIQMPEMDGVTATKSIRSLTGASSAIPIIALTANAMRGDREHYLATGMSDYLPKPVNHSDLLNTIARHVDLELPDIEVPDPSVIAEAEEQPKELNEDAAAGLTELMDDIDTLLDGTGN